MIHWRIKLKQSLSYSFLSINANTKTLSYYQYSISSLFLSSFNSVMASTTSFSLPYSTPISFNRRNSAIYFSHHHGVSLSFLDKRISLKSSLPFDQRRFLANGICRTPTNSKRFSVRCEASSTGTGRVITVKWFYEAQTLLSGVGHVLCPTLTRHRCI